MERLKIVLLVAAIVSTSQISQAQQAPIEAPPRNAASAAPSYTIIGDVRDPRTLAMPSGRLTIRSAVLQATACQSCLRFCLEKNSGTSTLDTAHFHGDSRHR